MRQRMTLECECRCTRQRRGQIEPLARQLRAPRARVSAASASRPCSSPRRTMKRNTISLATINDHAQARALSCRQRPLQLRPRRRRARPSCPQPPPTATPACPTQSPSQTLLRGDCRAVAHSSSLPNPTAQPLPRYNAVRPPRTSSLRTARAYETAVACETATSACSVVVVTRRARERSGGSGREIRGSSSSASSDPPRGCVRKRRRRRPA